MSTETEREMNAILGQEVISADLLRVEVDELRSKDLKKSKRIKELEDALHKAESKTIDYKIQEMVDEAVLAATSDIPDESSIEDIVYDKVEDAKDELEERLVNKVIKEIVSRLEY